MPGPRSAATAPLEGIRVLDLANEAGALATRILGDLGADVVMDFRSSH